MTEPDRDPGPEPETKPPAPGPDDRADRADRPVTARASQPGFPFPELSRADMEEVVRRTTAGKSSWDGLTAWVVDIIIELRAADRGRAAAPEVAKLERERDTARNIADILLDALNKKDRRIADLEDALRTHRPPKADDRRAAADEPLAFDSNVSETSPVVKGTLVAVSQVVSLIVNGWTLSNILWTYPELTENDIRAFVAYAMEHEDSSDPKGPANGGGSHG